MRALTAITLGIEELEIVGTFGPFLASFVGAWADFESSLWLEASETLKTRPVRVFLGKFVGSVLVFYLLSRVIMSVCSWTDCEWRYRK